MDSLGKIKAVKTVPLIYTIWFSVLYVTGEKRDTAFTLKS